MGLRIITFKISDELLDRLDRLALIKGVTRSEIIRSAIETYLARYDLRRPKWRVKVVRLG